MKAHVAVFALTFLTACGASVSEHPVVPSSPDATNGLRGQRDGGVVAGIDTQSSIEARFGLPAGRARLSSRSSCGERWIYTKTPVRSGAGSATLPPIMAEFGEQAPGLLVDFDADGYACRSVEFPM